MTASSVYVSPDILLDKDETNGFENLEFILAKHKKQAEVNQQQSIGQLTHQATLLEKWTSQQLEAIHGVEQKVISHVQTVQVDTQVEWSLTLGLLYCDFLVTGVRAILLSPCLVIIGLTVITKSCYRHHQSSRCVRKLSPQLWFCMGCAASL